MKVVLRIFIPLCIFSFIAFGISVMFLGTQPITADTAISELTISDSGANTYDITDSFTSIRADIRGVQAHDKAVVGEQDAGDGLRR